MHIIDLCKKAIIHLSKYTMFWLNRNSSVACQCSLPLFIIVLFSVRILFSGFANNWVKFVTIIARSAMIVWILLLSYSLLSSRERLFKLRPKAQQKIIKGLHPNH